ncbi:MAG: sterol desaturase family protein, partial [Candidatus Rokuibacteriota bacterium]
YDTRFGRGFISGVFAVAFGVLAVGGVLCLRFPALLTTPDARGYYPLDLFRFLIHLFLVSAFGLGVLSIVLSRRGPLGLTAIGCVVAASLFGGSQVPIEGSLESARFLGLDWFLLNVLVLAMLFVPLERLFARLPEQGIFRPGWLTDLLHFGVSHLLVQLTVFLTMAPAALFFRWAVAPELQAAVAAQPLAVQFVEVLVVADLTQYAVHRLFHRVPWLWRFHQIHHSSRHMDWLAGSRLHLVDIVVTRGLTFVPLYVAGFAPGPVFAYVLLVSFQAVLIHANVSWRFGPVRWLLATPQYHHWHHAVEPVDVNVAVHLPVIDAGFGTCYLPADRWPAVYGVAGNPVP